MSNPTPPAAADRGVLLDEWVQTRAEIARLEARSADLLAARSDVFFEDVQAAPRSRDMARRSMLAEYAVAGRVGTGTMASAFADAEALALRFPGLLAALRDGAISVAHVHVLIATAAPVVEAVHNGQLPEESVAMYEAACLVVAEQDSPTRTRVHARQVAATLTGATLRERHERAVKDRCVSVRALEDGMALLTVLLPETYAVAIKDRLHRLAGAIAADTRSETDRALGIAFTDPNADDTDGIGLDDGDDVGDSADVSDVDVCGDGVDIDYPDPAGDPCAISSGSTYAIDPEHDLHDPDTDDCMATKVGADAVREFVARDGRTRRQIETDILTDLLLAATPSTVFGTGLENITATVQVTINATTLTGENDDLAELDGHGPLHPDTARELARLASGWNRLFLTPEGMVTSVDRYTPNQAMKRFLRARDQRCRFPGCHAAAARCQIDHNHDYALGGPTTIENLACCCPAHHPLKPPDLDDDTRWAAHQLPDGTIAWTSPIGRTYTDPQPRHVMFV